MSNPIPQNYLDLIGSTSEMRGHVLSFKKSLPLTEFYIHDARFGSAFIMNTKTGKPKCATIEFLVSNSNMKRKQWTKPFPCREVEIKDEDLV